MRATTSLPIVVGAAADLVALGGVKSLARPGGNITGVTHAPHALDQKRLEILKEVPSVSRVAYLFDSRAIPETALLGLEESAGLLKVRVQRVGVNKPDEFEAAFTAIVKERAQAVLVQDAQVLSRFSEQVTALALRHRLPTMSQIPRFAERGGLLQYGADVFELFRRSSARIRSLNNRKRRLNFPSNRDTTKRPTFGLLPTAGAGVEHPTGIS